MTDTTSPDLTIADASATGAPKKFTISIYQDPSHIEGILQQANVGLITDASLADDTTNTNAATSTTDC